MLLYKEDECVDESFTSGELEGNGDLWDHMEETKEGKILCGRDESERIFNEPDLSLETGLMLEDEEEGEDEDIDGGVLPEFDDDGVVNGISVL